MRIRLNCNATNKTGKNMRIKVIIFAAFTLLISVFVMADGHKNSNISEEESGDPLIALHPTANQAAAAAYYKSVGKNVFNGAIPLKHAQLAAISASVAAKCLYCIPAHTAMAKAAGATDEEIKTAVAIAADVALNSSMLYGNQVDMDEFLQMFPQ
jgi:AhpD family alkylhydroperoxidase